MSIICGTVPSIEAQMVAVEWIRQTLKCLLNEGRGNEKTIPSSSQVPEFFPPLKRTLEYIDNTKKTFLSVGHRRKKGRGQRENRESEALGPKRCHQAGKVDGRGLCLHHCGGCPRRSCLIPCKTPEVSFSLQNSRLCFSEQKGAFCSSANYTFQSQMWRGQICEWWRGPFRERASLWKAEWVKGERWSKADAVLLMVASLYLKHHWCVVRA